jgi:hypothetical protein
MILPKDPAKPQPDGTVLIQIGFLYPLNYQHVAKNTVAAAQIFKYLPEGLANAGNFDIDRIQVTMLVPLDTRTKWGYVTTIAKLYYPENLIDALQVQLWAPNSEIYVQSNQLVQELTSVINPEIDIFGNIEEDGGNDNGGSNGDNNGGGDSNDAFDGGNDSGSSSKQTGTVAGIAVGAVGLAGLYGAAMFILARRYKRKRQAHRRSNSLQGSDYSSEMQYTGTGSPALMGGALLSRDMSNYGGASGGRDSQNSGHGSSARGANISAPVATENSLGWN